MSIFNEIFEYAKEGYKDALERLILTQDVDVNITDDEGMTPLCWAASNGHEDVCRLLLLQGADVNQADSREITPLMYAALRKDREKICELLLQNNASRNATNDQGLTALHIAAERGFTKFCEILIRNGALIDFPTRDRQTALSKAAFMRHRGVVDLLLVAGSSLESLTDRTDFAFVQSRITLLKSATQEKEAERRKQAPQTVVSGQKGGAQPDGATQVENPDNENTASGQRPPSPVIAAARGGTLEDVQSCLLRGPDLSSTGSGPADADPPVYGWTALHWAAHRAHVPMMECLVKAGAPLDKQDGYGFTPLHIAANAGSYGFCEKLINAGAQLTLPSFMSPAVPLTLQGRLPLHCAAISGNKEVVDLLLISSTDVQPNCLDALSRTPLHFAARKGYVEVVQSLMDAGADPLMPSTSGDLPIHLAAWAGQEDVCQLLVSYVACSMLQQVNKKNISAITMARSSGRAVLGDRLQGVLNSLCGWSQPAAPTASEASRPPSGPASRASSSAKKAATTSETASYGDEGFEDEEANADDGESENSQNPSQNGGIAAQNGATPLYGTRQNGNKAVAAAPLDLGAQVDKPANVTAAEEASAYSAPSSESRPNSELSFTTTDKNANQKLSRPGPPQTATVPGSVPRSESSAHSVASSRATSQSVKFVGSPSNAKSVSELQSQNVGGSQVPEVTQTATVPSSIPRSNSLAQSVASSRATSQSIKFTGSQSNTKSASEPQSQYVGGSQVPADATASSNRYTVDEESVVEDEPVEEEEEIKDEADEGFVEPSKDNDQEDQANDEADQEEQANDEATGGDDDSGQQQNLEGSQEQNGPPQSENPYSTVEDNESASAEEVEG